MILTCLKIYKTMFQAFLKYSAQWVEPCSFKLYVKILTVRTYESEFILKQVFVNVTNLKYHHTKPPNSMTGIVIRKRKFEQRHVKIQCGEEAEVICKLRNAKDCWQPSDTCKKMNVLSLRIRKRNQNCRHFGLPASRTMNE